MFLKKKKNLLELVIIGLIVAVIIGTAIFILFDRKAENNYQEEVLRLQEQLSSLRSEISNLSEGIKKDQLKSRLLFLENLTNNLSNREKQNKQTVERLKKEIKKLKKRLEDNEPDEDQKPDKKEGEFIFVGKGIDSNGNENYMFDEVEDRGKMINVNKNHPGINSLLNKGKLSKVNFNTPEKFTIRFSEKDDYETGSNFAFFFDEFNTELEIIEN